MAFSKYLIFKTEIFKGIGILNLFNVYRLSASNLSCIITEENKDNVLDVKENIDGTGRQPNGACRRLIRET